jgi:hypothetical protein
VHTERRVAAPCAKTSTHATHVPTHRQPPRPGSCVPCPSFAGCAPGQRRHSCVHAARASAGAAPGASAGMG